MIHDGSARADRARRLRLRLCLAAAVAGMAATVVVFQPGTMSMDAIVQLTEARSGIYHDWHPPLLTWIWSWLDAVVPGPVGLLLLQNAMFWAGLALVVYLCDVPAAWTFPLVLGLGAFPPVLSALGTIWKDVAMAAALLLAFALLLRAHVRAASWLPVGLALAALFCAVAFRHDAALAVYPLALWLGAIVDGLSARDASRRRKWRGLVLGHVVMGGLVGLALGAESGLVGDRRLFPSQQILVHDLIAISVRTGTIEVPERLVERGGPLSVETLACLYTPDSAVSAFSARHDACPLLLRKVTDERGMSALRRAWLRAVPRHPGAYAAHRLSVWREMLAFGRPRVCYPLQPRTDPNALGVESRPSPLRARVLEVARLAAYETPLFRPWLYLALVIVLLGAAPVIGRGDPVPAVVLGGSALLYTGGHLVVGTACDFRLSWWPIVAAAVLPLVTWRGGAAQRPRARGTRARMRAIRSAARPSQ